MNQTLVDSTIYSKVKRLNLEIKQLKSDRITFGLDNEQTLLLKLKEDKLEKLIEKL